NLAVQTELAGWPHPRETPRGGVSSFGFGGTNCHVVLEAAPASRAVIVPLAAEDAASLRREVLATLDRASQLTAWDGVTALAREACARASEGAHRAAVVGGGHEELLAGLTSVLARPRQATEAPSRRPRVVFVCPGQGSQWAGMARTLL